jgi:hypothetical protein
VQRVHQLVASQRPDWPILPLPEDRGRVTIRDVMAEPPGERRDHAIDAWATSTWEACSGLREPIQAFLSERGITSPAP